MDIKSLIGETTEYDKKLRLEEKNRRAGARLSVPLRTHLAVFLSLAFLMMMRSSGLKMLPRMLKKSAKSSRPGLIQYLNSPLNSIRKITRI